MKIMLGKFLREYKVTTSLQMRDIIFSMNLSLKIKNGSISIEKRDIEIN